MHGYKSRFIWGFSFYFLCGCMPNYGLEAPDEPQGLGMKLLRLWNSCSWYTVVLESHGPWLYGTDQVITVSCAMPFLLVLFSDPLHDFRERTYLLKAVSWSLLTSMLSYFNLVFWILLLLMLSSLSIFSEVFLTGNHAAETYGNLIMEFISRLA